MERNFVLSGLTNSHAEKDMTATFKVVLEQLKDLLPNEYKVGRSSRYIIPNILANGAAIIEEEAGRQMEAPSRNSRSEVPGDGGEAALEDDDEMSDLEEVGNHDAEEEELEVELTAEDLSIECEI